MSRLRPWRGMTPGGRDRTVSVHVTSSTSGRAFQRTLSWWTVRVLCAAGVVLTLIVVVGIGGLFGWLHSTARIRRLQAENDSLRVQFRRLGELEDNLARMSELNDKMRQMLGVDLPVVGSGKESLGGTGSLTGEGARRAPSDGAPEVEAGGAPLSGRTGKAPPMRRTEAD
jgi:hypothetical protein